MTRKLFHLGLLMIVLVAGAMTYAVCRSQIPLRTQPLDCARRWLCLSGAQCNTIQSKDPNYAAEIKTLSQSLKEARQVLAAMVTDPQTSDQDIREQAQVVMEAHHMLLRRTIRHLLVMKEYMDNTQCARLNNLCANIMYAGRGRGQGRGGPGQSRGNGMGMRHRWRHGQNPLAPALSLTDAQLKNIAQIDPNYEVDAEVLALQVKTAHLALAQTLQDSNSQEESVLQILEHFIETKTALEERTVDYVLSLRPLLTPEQQQHLIGLSRGGHRWRGGR